MGSDDVLSEFFRHFSVPGFGHVGSGPVPDSLAAVIDWVEKGWRGMCYLPQTSTRRAPSGIVTYVDIHECQNMTERVILTCTLRPRGAWSALFIWQLQTKSNSEQIETDSPASNAHCLGSFTALAMQVTYPSRRDHLSDV